MTDQGRAITDARGGRTRTRHGGRARARLAVLLLVSVAACGDDPTFPRGIGCDLDPDLMRSSLGPDAIPALNEPAMVAADDPSVAYLLDADRVLGVFLNGEARAYPHNILWYHEIVNDRIGEDWVSVTFCPLTGSGLAFEPVIGTRRMDFGVSGLLYANNLVMYDRSTDEVFGPQLTVDGACEGFRGQSIPLVPVQEMSWRRWKELHPNTTVVTGNLTFGRNYTSYPYGTYNRLTSNELLVLMPVDRTRAIKERVLAIRDGSGGRGYPFGELAELGSVSVVNESVAGVPTVVFYDEADGETAIAFDARVAGQALTFDADPAGFWTDRETGSTWSVDGLATSGPLAGARLETRSDAYTLFWFAWRHFQPDGRMFAAP